MQDERRNFKPSAKRDTPVKENQRLFQLLLKGEKEAEPYCLRAKADYASVNGETGFWAATIDGSGTHTQGGEYERTDWRSAKASFQ